MDTVGWDRKLVDFIESMLRGGLREPSGVSQTGYVAVGK